MSCSSPDIEILSEKIKPMVAVVLPQNNAQEPVLINCLPTAASSSSANNNYYVNGRNPLENHVLSQCSDTRFVANSNGNRKNIRFSPPHLFTKDHQTFNIPQITAVRSLKPLAEHQNVSNNRCLPNLQANHDHGHQKNMPFIPGVRIRPPPLRPANVQNWRAVVPPATIPQNAAVVSKCSNSMQMMGSGFRSANPVIPNGFSGNFNMIRQIPPVLPRRVEPAVVGNRIILPAYEKQQVVQPTNVGHFTAPNLKQPTADFSNLKQLLQAPSKETNKRKRSNSSSSSNSVIFEEPSSSRIVSVAKKRSASPRVQSSNNSTNGQHFPFFIYGRVKPAGWVAQDVDEESVDKPFLCGLCEKVLGNNVSLMWHTYAHYLFKSEGANEDLSDVSTCWKCLGVFENPYVLLDHVTKVHDSNGMTSNLICHICEREFPDSGAFDTHVKVAHCSKPDMPYLCPVCKYQSSLYKDIMDHFLQAHCNTNLLMCPFCLLLIKEHKDPDYSNIIVANDFITHMWLHLEKKKTFQCTRCILFFATTADLSKHKAKMHCSIISSNAEKLHVAFRDFRPLGLVEEKDSKPLCCRSVRQSISFHFDEVNSRCIECHRWLSDANHFFKDSKKCTHCRFATNCCVAYKNHVDRHGVEEVAFVSALFREIEPILDNCAECACGFKTNFGIKIAKHVQSCKKSFGVAAIIAENNDDMASDVMSNKMLSALNLHSVQKFKDTVCVNSDNVDSPQDRPATVACFSPSHLEPDEEVIRSPKRPSLLSLAGLKKIDQPVFSPTKAQNVGGSPEKSASAGNVKSPSYVNKCRSRLSRMDNLKKRVDDGIDMYRGQRFAEPFDKWTKINFPDQKNVAEVFETFTVID